MTRVAAPPPALVAALRSTLFAPRRDDGPPAIGAELELLPVDEETHRIAPIGDAQPGERTSLALLRDAGAAHGWREHRPEPASLAAPWFQLPGGGRITFEPGGQLEYSSRPHRSLGPLLADLRAVAAALQRAGAARGIALRSVGIDPVNPVAAAPLQLRSARYSRMAEYFARRGVAGARMMRQTASLQLAIDPGEHPAARWRLLNALAPTVLALFANSARYEGMATGHRSFRAAAWRAIDPLRTGLLPPVDDPADAYARFALAAPAMLLGPVDGAYRPCGEWLSRGAVTTADWTAHLSTLFPEVRPRGYFELRSCDAVPLDYIAAPFVFVAGLVYDERRARAAAAMLGEPDAARLVIAGREGLRDRTIARDAAALCDLALEGARALGPAYVPAAELERAADYFARYTRRYRSPADDVAAVAAPGTGTRLVST